MAEMVSPIWRCFLVIQAEALQFNELEINKTNNASVILQDAIGVTRRFSFLPAF
jgi:hypothetical protein